MEQTLFSVFGMLLWFLAHCRPVLVIISKEGVEILKNKKTKLEQRLVLLLKEMLKLISPSLSKQSPFSHPNSQKSDIVTTKPSRFVSQLMFHIWGLKDSLYHLCIDLVDCLHAVALNTFQTIDCRINSMLNVTVSSYSGQELQPFQTLRNFLACVLIFCYIIYILSFPLSSRSGLSFLFTCFKTLNIPCPTQFLTKIQFYRNMLVSVRTFYLYIIIYSFFEGSIEVCLNT